MLSISKKICGTTFYADSSLRRKPDQFFIKTIKGYFLLEKTTNPE